MVRTQKAFCQIFFILASFFFGANAIATTAELVEQKKILILSSSHLTESFVYGMIKGLKADLEQRDPTLDFSYESLSSVPSGDDKSAAEFYSWLETKYSSKRTDVVVTIGQPALAYALQHRDSLWKNAPMVYIGVTPNQLISVDLSGNVTGIATDRSILSFTKMAASISSRFKQLVIVGDVPGKGDPRLYFATEVADASNILPIVDVRGQPLDAVQKIVSSLPSTSLIYFTKFTEDGSGQHFSSEGVLRTLAASASAPILVDNETWLYPNVLAALATPISARAQVLADMTWKVLESKSATGIPHQVKSDQLTVNKLEISRWGVEQAKLPKDVNWKYGLENGTPDRFRISALTFSAITLFFSVLIIALLLERKSRTRAVKKSRQYLAEIAHINRNTTASVYAATIAHELNQPLAAIAANCDAIAHYLSSTPPEILEANEALDDVRNDSKRATNLIAKLRTITKKDEATLVVADLNLVIENTLRFLAPEIKMRRAKVATMFGAAAALVKIDTIQIQQVLTNLLINSLDAMSGMAASDKNIRIETRTDGQCIYVEIIDSGSGFDENIEKVFDSFFTTKAHGLGLGLAITSSILENHGGHITARNVPSGGAAVTFSLPIAEKQ